MYTHTYTQAHYPQLGVIQGRHLLRHQLPLRWSEFVTCKDGALGLPEASYACPALLSFVLDGV